MVEFHRHAKEKKLDTEEHMLNDFINMYFYKRENEFTVKKAREVVIPG